MNTYRVAPQAGPLSSEEVLVAVRNAVAWLKRSHDMVGGGVGCFEVARWTAPYPEVSGYTIPTFWNAADALGDPELADRARAITDWEVEIQRESGGFEGSYHGAGRPPLVFNTAQVIRGLLRTYKETKEDRYLVAAVRAGNWIVECQEDDGSWARTNYQGMRRVYDSYVAAPLAQLWTVTGDEAYRSAALRNAEYVLSNQLPNGWFDECDNTLGGNAAPILHTIAYTVDGLLELGDLLGEEVIRNAGVKTGKQLLRLAEVTPRLSARFDREWTPVARYTCLTGCAQVGLVFQAIDAREPDQRLKQASEALFRFLTFTQELNGVGKDRRGGIPGSFPIWGAYSPFRFPSWAAKYFVDLGLKHLARSESMIVPTR